MTISERIFEIMRMKNIRQKDLSKSIGIPTATISTWNTRNTSPPAEKIIEIADYLGVSVYYLLTGEEQNAVNINGSSNNTNIGENAVMNVPYSNLDKHDKEILEEYNKLSLKNKAKVISYMTELEDTAEEW